MPFWPSSPLGSWPAARPPEKTSRSAIPGPARRKRPGIELGTVSWTWSSEAPFRRPSKTASARRGEGVPTDRFNLVGIGSTRSQNGPEERGDGKNLLEFQKCIGREAPNGKLGTTWKSSLPNVPTSPRITHRQSDDGAGCIPPAPQKTGLCENQARASG